MDWFIFILISTAWVTSLFFLLQKKTIIRTTVFAGFSMLLGAGLLADGVSFPTGWNIVSSGTTKTITQTFTNYTQSSNAWILGIGWTLLFTGLYFIIEVWTGLISLLGNGFSNVREKYGI